jgi:hypothetical protein
VRGFLVLGSRLRRWGGIPERIGVSSRRELVPELLLEGAWTLISAVLWRGLWLWRRERWCRGMRSCWWHMAFPAL